MVAYMRSRAEGLWGGMCFMQGVYMDPDRKGQGYEVGQAACWDDKFIPGLNGLPMRSTRKRRLPASSSWTAAESAPWKWTMAKARPRFRTVSESPAHVRDEQRHIKLDASSSTSTRREEALKRDST